MPGARSRGRLSRSLTMAASHVPLVAMWNVGLAACLLRRHALCLPRDSCRRLRPSPCGRACVVRPLAGMPGAAAPPTAKCATKGASPLIRHCLFNGNMVSRRVGRSCACRVSGKIALCAVRGIAPCFPHADGHDSSRTGPPPEPPERRSPWPPGTPRCGPASSWARCCSAWPPPIRKFDVTPAGPETVLAELTKAVVGSSVAFSVIQMITLVLLVLAANTSPIGRQVQPGGRALDRGITCLRSHELRRFT